MPSRSKLVPASSRTRAPDTNPSARPDSTYAWARLFAALLIVPADAVIVREFFPPEQAGMRVGAVRMATVFGMALGGWMSGVIFDRTGWNLLDIAIAVTLLRQPARSLARQSA